MKNQGMIAFGLLAFALWIATRELQPQYAGIAIEPDTGGNFPPIYPDVTGSGSVDPIATWPGWVGTPEYAPYPGMLPEPGEYALDL
jgi:hypothetical protein